MFTKGDPAKAIADLKNENRGLFDEIKKFVDKWVKKLKEFYSGKTISEEGAAVSQLENFEKIQKIFMEAMEDAGKNFAAAEVASQDETENGNDGWDIKLSERDETAFVSFRRKINDVINQAVSGKGYINGKLQAVPIMPVGPKLSAMVAAASDHTIDISQKYIAINSGEVWHEYKRHTVEADEVSRDQVVFTKRQFQNAVKCIIDPDIVEAIFTDPDNPTQRQSFAYAKKTTRGHYVVVEAVGGKNKPIIYPVMILQFSKSKWNKMIDQGKSLGEILHENDLKKLSALDSEKNLKSRVFAAQFASDEAIANTPHSPQLNSTVPQTEYGVKTEKNLSAMRKWTILPGGF